MAIKNDPKNSGTFIVSYGKRHPVTRISVSLTRKGFKSMAEAKRAYNDLVVEVESRIKKTIVPTWAKILEESLAASADRGLTKKTIYDHRVCLEAHTLELWGERLIDSITTQDVKTLLQQKVGQRTQAHQQYFLKCIRSVFSHALEANYIVRNPTPQIKFKIAYKVRKVLTEEQARQLLAKAKDQEWIWYPHYAVALYTGMRCGELFALEWDKVDFDRRQILVDVAWNSRDGLKCTKSGDDRIIEIAPALLPILRELQKQADGAPSVLPRLYQWQKGEQAMHLAAFLAANGLPVVRFHDLRATWATILLTKGVEPIKVMKMGGWKNLETMMIYARKAGVDIRGAMDLLNFHTDIEPNKILRMAEPL